MNLSEALDLPTVPELEQRRELAGSPVRLIRKSDLAAAISGTLLTGDLGPIWSQLSELEVSAVSETVHRWGGRFDPVRFRAKYGALPTHFDYDPPAPATSASPRLGVFSRYSSTKGRS
jgi:hypothetical protein